ncbi:hypothetical protein FI667_g6280, partial [Globisporangium splendens]
MCKGSKHRPSQKNGDATSSGATTYGSTDSTTGKATPTSIKDFTPSPRHRRLTSWYINMSLINFVEFSAESSRGVVLATLFLYTKSLGGDLAFMGLLTSVFPSLAV